MLWSLEFIPSLVSLPNINHTGFNNVKLFRSTVITVFTWTVQTTVLTFQTIRFFKKHIAPPKKCDNVGHEEYEKQ